MKKVFRPIAALAFLGLLIAVVYLYTRRPPPTPAPVSGKLVVRCLDVGQGDSELIEMPDGETILIDAGEHGSPTVDLLKKHGVTRIDLAIATHPHSDHIGEMREVLRAFEVKEFWDSGFVNPTKTYSDLLQEVGDRNIRFANPRRGEVRSYGAVQLEVLNPGPLFPDGNPNNASIVVRLTFGNTRLLFAGDAESPAWQQMIETAGDRLEADLLKAAHHGSSDGMSRDILEAVRPSMVAISCAAGNEFHHPQPKTIHLLEQRVKSTSLFRTDLQGEITAVCDGLTIDVTTERPLVEAERYLTGDEVASKLASSGDRRGGRRRAARGSR
ncbi:MAG TPA: MBL fold metallo-hydrolase [Blastocatellia bacterium]|nr:MBL fold metallo-hydrolase [Blastocatellia bacterium]